MNANENSSVPNVSDSDLLISGLQHFSFCRRQWALIHIESQWSENYLTVDGKLKHDNADDPYFTEKRGDLLISRAVPVRSDRYGIVGKCDVVEFRRDDSGVRISGRDGLWLPTPVEYKRGHTKEIDADRLQLCAEAMCLEEMLCCPEIGTAYLYYMETKRREAVKLDAALRDEVADARYLDLLVKVSDIFKIYAGDRADPDKTYFYWFHGDILS